MGEFLFTHGQSPWNSALRVIREMIKVKIKSPSVPLYKRGIKNISPL